MSLEHDFINSFMLAIYKALKEKGKGAFGQLPPWFLCTDWSA